MSDYWRRCSNCKKSIGFDSLYWVCNVSTCNRKRTGLVFCSVDCWDAHLPLMRHKESWAEERHSPKTGAQSPGDSNRSERTSKKRIEMRARPSASPSSGSGLRGLQPRPADEILVVASKVKAYVRSRGGLSTSAAVMDELSDRLRDICDLAIQTAVKNERKTMLDRDIP